MRPWLAAAAAVPLLVPAAAVAQADFAQPLSSPKSHTAPNFTLPAIPEFTSQSPLQDGMLAEDDLASNAHLGLGLVRMSSRKKRGLRLEQEPVITRNPGVSLVIQFGR